MDNFHIDLASEGSLAPAMKIAFRNYKSIAYNVGSKGLVFFWYVEITSPPLIELPFKLDSDGAADFATRWLAEQDYGREPGHDGDNVKGWRLYTEGWGGVASWNGSIVAVKPAWACYGK